jgi:hypothetical protein
MRKSSLYRSPAIIRVIKFVRLRWQVMKPKLKKIGVLSKFNR